MYNKYAPYGFKLVVLSYVDECVYFYTYEELVKSSMDPLRKRFHLNLLGYAHWFMPISISQIRYHYISVDETRYDISAVKSYLVTAAIK